MKAKRASATCDQRTRIMGLFLAGVYTITAKAALLLAVLGHLRLLRGLVRLPVADWANSLSDCARQRLWADTRRLAARLNLIISAATGVWMFAQALPLGITAWSWVLSVWLLGMVLTQGSTLKGHSRSVTRSGCSVGPGSMFSMAKQAPFLFSCAEAWASVLIIACPAAANCQGAAVNKLAWP